jgi:hypothetical protein
MGDGDFIECDCKGGRARGQRNLKTLGFGRIKLYLIFLTPG